MLRSEFKKEKLKEIASHYGEASQLHMMFEECAAEIKKRRSAII